MENKLSGNKKNYIDSPKLNSPCKVQKMNKNQDTKRSSTPPTRSKNAAGQFSNVSIDNKMNNVAKLREQFVEEIKNIELSLKESIMNLKLKISETKKKTNIITDKLTQANKLLCEQSGIIYTKEQENKVLREKVEELYEYQKKIFENMEDIFNTLNSHENLSEKLTHTYDTVLLMQENYSAILEKNLNELTPDENLITEYNEVNAKISEYEYEIKETNNEITLLETEIKDIQNYKEQQRQTVEQLENKINELETRNKISIENANKEKKKLTDEIDKIINTTNIRNSEIAILDKNLSKLELTVKKKRDYENEIKKKIEEINNNTHLLTIECTKLDEIRQEEDQQNAITIKTLEEKLKASKDELILVKKKEVQATTVLQTKIAELRNNLKDYDDLEPKINELKTQIKNEEESIKQMTQEHQNWKKDYDNNMKVTNDNLIQAKINLNKIEHKIHDYEEEIKSLEEDINKLNTKLEEKNKKVEQNTGNRSYASSISQHGLPDLFALENIGSTEKTKSRKKLYTPTIADDDLELDALSLEEQFTHLTQTKSSQSESPDKNKKFFKHSNLSQPKNKKEGTPRPRGRGKKY